MQTLKIFKEKMKQETLKCLKAKIPNNINNIQ